MANPMSALDEIRELQRKTLKYATPNIVDITPEGYAGCVYKFEWPTHFWTIRLRDDIYLPEQPEAKWFRLCRKWASKHDRAIPSMPGGY